MMRRVLDFSRDYENERVKTCSLKGIGIIASRFSRQEFAAYLEETLQLLSSLSTSPSNTREESPELFESITAASIVLAVYQVNDVNLSQHILSRCLPALPLTEDI